MNHYYNDPKDSRKILKNLYIKFYSSDIATHALSELGDKEFKINISGSLSCIMAPVISVIDLKRNWNLREAKKLIKSSPHSNGKEVKIQWKSRVIEVDNSSVFQQTDGELGGSFSGLFSTLHLP